MKKRKKNTISKYLTGGKLGAELNNIIQSPNIQMMGFDLATTGLGNLVTKSVADMFSTLRNPEQEMRMTKSNTQAPMATGGIVEVEGQEILETPNGDISKVKGASHENGGVKMSLPANTKVYSKRVKKEGEAMNKRKLKRERQKKNIMSYMGDDVISKQSANRSLQHLEAEEQEDMMLQQALNNLQNTFQQFANGGIIPPIQLPRIQSTGLNTTTTLQPKEEFLGKEDGFDIIGERNLPSYLQGIPGLQMGTSKNMEFGKPKTEGIPGLTFSAGKNMPFGKPSGIPGVQFSAGKNMMFGHQTPIIDIPNIATPQIPIEDKKIDVPRVDSPMTTKAKEIENNVNNTNQGFGITLGDAIGLSGTLEGKFMPMLNTILNRAGDTPNVNMYRDFGTDALSKIEEAKQLSSISRDDALQDISLQEGAARRRNRNSARSINTLRALDIATDRVTNEAEGNANLGYSQQLAQLLTQQAGLENVQDQVVMGGEQQRDLADRQDRDNYFTQMAQNIANSANFTQKLGRDLNQVKGREDFLKLLPELSQYGIGIEYDAQGNPQVVNAKNNVSEIPNIEGLTQEQNVTLSRMPEGKNKKFLMNFYKATSNG
jgi:hypothetical protein